MVTEEDRKENQSNSDNNNNDNNSDKSLIDASTKQDANANTTVVSTTTTTSSESNQQSHNTDTHTSTDPNSITTTTTNASTYSETIKHFSLPPPVEIPQLETQELPPLRERIHFEPFIRSELPQQPSENLTEHEDKNDEVQNLGVEEIHTGAEEEPPTSANSDTEIESEEEDEVEESETEEAKKLQAEETTSKLVGIGTIPPEVEKTLGKLKEFKLPEKPAEMKNLERDLRKLNEGLDGLSPDERKYTKLVIIKHYDLLFRTFRRYCKIGGDTHWMTENGWVQLLLDCNIPTKAIEKCDKEGFQELFTRVFTSHQKKKSKVQTKGKKKPQKLSLEPQRSGAYGELGDLLQDDDPWTGIWEENRGDTGAVERYRLKQVGDRKVVGCIKASDYCEITGVLGQLDHSKGNLVIKWYQGARKGQARKMLCQLRPPDSSHSRELARMEIKWTAIEDGKSHASGNMMLHKVEPLDNDAGLPITQGLARYEFWDAICLLVLMRWPELKRFEAIDVLCREHIFPYIWEPIEKFDEKAKRTLIQKNKVNLRKLFTAYAGMDNDENADDDGLGIEEWELFCADVLTVGAPRFKNGGKPTLAQINAAFFLTLPELEQELDFAMFLKALENLAQEILKKRPKAKYQTPPVDERLKILVEEMCAKLHTKGGNPSQQKLTRMKTKTQT